MADTLEKAIDDTILQIKAMMLIAGNDKTSINRIRRTFQTSKDQNLMEFRQIVGQQENHNDLIYAAIGEFFLSAFMILLSVIMMVPSLFSFVNTQLSYNYLRSFALNVVKFNTAGYIEIIATLAIAFTILFLALHTIRLAAEKINNLW
ncbi:TVG0802745 [Thermoplasma volcanium GSS1]|uniref:TVG0802745 protein n=1 Tax=Thermoplasma volcanium (strain ATCC 51530 / DSM 4299 / JCM 9571 / NBRC 15438 / GSS1) TaxID=273116 RepID=Q97AK8_THEVO|nr:hypothetical protein [Thermoplasma volcanium]BAB59944.1 TVG0802745 [Thermoplasma volcanium GSS1]